ncbi:Serine hydrolase-like protein 2 [Polyrhizophydium stewartii]|uniref:Serine hydrolase-like protein 2 n=1 Tax=Polyrhizophydium stewartii TaxID=2732419 RepID=A0ABR4N8P3_9FUNG
MNFTNYQSMETGTPAARAQPLAQPGTGSSSQLHQLLENLTLHAVSSLAALAPCQRDPRILRVLIPSLFYDLEGFVLEILRRVEVQVLFLMADHDYTPTFMSKEARDILGPKAEYRLMKDIPSHNMHLEPEYADRVGVPIVEYWSRQQQVAASKSVSPHDNVPQARL